MSWKNPGYSGGQFKKILVLALNGRAANRMEFEDQLVAAITRPVGKAYPSYEFIMRPDATPIGMKDMRELVKGAPAKPAERRWCKSIALKE